MRRVELEPMQRRRRLPVSLGELVEPESLEPRESLGVVETTEPVGPDVGRARPWSRG